MAFELTCESSSLQSTVVTKNDRDGDEALQYVGGMHTSTMI